MPILPFRGLATRGILKDPSPYDLEDNAWSGGVNVRFANTKASRSPVFRVGQDALTTNPAFVVGSPQSTGFDKVVYADTTGRLWTYFSGTLTETTPTGFTPGVVSGQYTAGFLGDVLYVNNPARGLYYVGPAGGNFALDPQWDPTWSTAVFRVYQDYPIALNVTKGAQANPTLVKWGSNTLAGQTTTSWNSNDPTTNAGETPIADLTGPILDGCVMRGAFIIYSQDQIWQMVADGSTYIFEFSRLFSEGGIIGTNCVCEVNGLHYVFGPNDIYKHDGVNKVSLLDKRNRLAVYRFLNKSLANRCFVQHNPEAHEIIFAYPSTDNTVAFPNPTLGCNYALVYNYFDDTHSFVDLPNVTSMSLANLNTVLTWGTTGSLTWATVGGSWADQQDSYGRNVVAASCAQTGLVTNNRLLALDGMNTGTSLALPFVQELNPTAYLERVGLSLSEAGAPLSDYKSFNRIYPQVVNYAGVPVTIQVGASLYPSGPVTWMPPVSYDPTTDYKVDVRGGGRYLAYRISVPMTSDFDATGFDAEVLDRGSR